MMVTSTFSFFYIAFQSASDGSTLQMYEDDQDLVIYSVLDTMVRFFFDWIENIMEKGQKAAMVF